MLSGLMSRWTMPYSDAALQGGGDLAHDADREEHLGRAFHRQVFFEVSPLDVLQGDIGHARDFAGGVHLQDVGMGGAGDRLGLGLEPRQRLGRSAANAGGRILSATLRFSDSCSAR